MPPLLKMTPLGILAALAAISTCGCRSAQVNSTPGPNSAPPPYAQRGFDRRSIYDDTVESIPPVPPVDGGSLPTPGFSEPELPTPAPSTQRKRRALFPARRLPDSQDESNLNQTSGRRDSRPALNLGRMTTIPPVPPASSIPLNSEPVPLPAPASDVQRQDSAAVSPTAGNELQAGLSNRRPARQTFSTWPVPGAANHRKQTANAGTDGYASVETPSYQDTTLSVVPRLLPENN